ncbi:hypothetical protein BO70DRAFT_416757 [Aspergillus heteromorphus CBS 117.55]|uniref:Histone-lysine N-methyltransferase SET5 n=1 Tax=Aspergillus heteromorphus CBS 117.55 TaxID=1448321 RepID=A0A317V5G8_9EURO|nr:uncharacterized protein BO70DRAFT_416757 [Aspergillus heteromorphus CBS 117.55]PWY69533.1 hypothetical protein BO70DRAFT_416757 [Aspergillus heteromorphus CBS 117.55]
MTAVNQLPPHQTIKPPPFARRPDLYDEIEWRPHISPPDAKVAYRFWSLPDTLLGQTMDKRERFLRPIMGDMHQLHGLARNVYDHLMEDHLLPLIPSKWQEKWNNDGLDQAHWSFDDIFNNQGFDMGDSMEDPDLVEGREIDGLKVIDLKMMLHRRNLPTEGKIKDLRQRLRDYKRSVYQKYQVLPRSRLSDWGIQRDEVSRYTITITNDGGIGPLDMYTCAILLSPYNPTYWLSRAYCHYQLAFFDLAVGDAYRAHLLCEVLVNPLLRNRQPGLYTRIWQAIEQHIIAGGHMIDPHTFHELDYMRMPNGINYFVPTMRKAIQNIISLGLAALQSWDDYKVKEKELLQRIVMPDRDTTPFKERWRVMKHGVLTRNPALSAENPNVFFYEKRSGSAPGGRKYPYDANDKDRSTNAFTDTATRNLVTENDSLPWKRCRVGVTTMPNGDQLGMFATTPIAAGEIIFVEIPSVRGHLSPKTPFHRETIATTGPISLRCDNCKADIPHADAVRYSQGHGTRREVCKCITAPSCLAFCPEADPNGPTCAENARERYHFRACGKDWDWLHDAMRLNEVTTGPAGYETTYYSHTNEQHTTILSLLLREVFDITLHRRQTDPHLMAHEVDELLVLESTQNWENQSFPFTFCANIQVPFDILMQLGVDIFSDLTFDTWVIQLIMRKLTVNATPWDHIRRKKHKIITKKDIPPAANQPGMTRAQWEKLEPSFHNLYLFPGFSLFNHACGYTHYNAFYGYDPTVPNRMLVWASRAIQQDEEIFIHYFHPMDAKVNREMLTREIGQKCCCPGNDHLPTSTLTGQRRCFTQ